MEELPERKAGRGRTARTIESLKLDTKAAQEGKTWLLLPEGYRAQEFGQTYPLPSRTTDLQVLSTLYVPKAKIDSGCLYIRRAIEKLKEQGKRKQSALLDMTARVEQTKHTHENYLQRVKQLRQEMIQVVDGVRAEAAKAVANLNDLFSLGREGIEGQMKAHLAGHEWKGEAITASAFRDCFRMVTQAVKGLGLPSGQRESAEKAIIEELAASLEATKDAISLAPPEETEH